MHIGGESSRQVASLEMSRSGAQLTLWRMRSTLLYYRKHHGFAAIAARLLETGWYTLPGAAPLSSAESVERRREAGYFRAQASLMRQAWRETAGGRISPQQPW